MYAKFDWQCGEEVSRAKNMQSECWYARCVIAGRSLFVNRQWDLKVDICIVG